MDSITDEGKQVVDLVSNWVNYIKLKQPSLGRVAVVALGRTEYTG